MCVPSMAPTAVGEAHSGKAVHDGVDIPQSDDPPLQYGVDGLDHLQEHDPDHGFSHTELVPY